MFFFLTFAVIAIKPLTLPYMDALLSKDYDLDLGDVEKMMMSGSSLPGAETSRRDANLGTGINSDLLGSGQASESTESDTIDNPYLRPVRIPTKAVHVTPAKPPNSSLYKPI